eukprot:TRINITY_DN1997_c0_g1_i2.p2 TRINITY_DN1997_c0_g1~~TRINITY_DN1997_c0_g1_i2.p2  ORF type:complete len:187 (-),score=33.49 TRINITY_DN1997_c0_g1_i2:26-586(-)
MATAQPGSRLMMHGGRVVVARPVLALAQGGGGLARGQVLVRVQPRGQPGVYPFPPGHASGPYGPQPQQPWQQPQQQQQQQQQQGPGGGGGNQRAADNPYIFTPSPQYQQPQQQQYQNRDQHQLLRQQQNQVGPDASQVPPHMQPQYQRGPDRPVVMFGPDGTPQIAQVVARPKPEAEAVAPRRERQ